MINIVVIISVTNYMSNVMTNENCDLFRNCVFLLGIKRV